MSLRVSFRSFGCRLNQSESESIAAAFSAAGALVVPFGESADAVVVNTCTVTGKAEQKARRELRAIAARWPEAAILVTGCYAELEPDALSAMTPRAVVVPGSRKGALVAMAAGIAGAALEGLDPFDEARRLALEALGREPEPFAFRPGDFRFRSRASLKVQDGCDNRCSYCRVCLARGGSVSLDPEEALRRARALEAEGYPEIVLTGVNLSQYRWKETRFPGLLELLESGTVRAAFRISSWEPDRVDDDFLRAFSLPRVRPHLHLAAQSGSSAVLSAMRRRYGRDDILRAADAARAARGDPFIGMDLIAGFPGETEDDFRATVDLIERVEPAWVHAFTFSPRPGTPAFSMKPRVPERVAAERASVIGELARRGKRRFAERRLGLELEAVLESSRGDEADGSADPGAILPGPAAASDRTRGATAVTAEYLKARIRGVPEGSRGVVRCRVTGLADAAGAGDDGLDLEADWIS